MTQRIKAVIIDDDVATLDGLKQSVNWDRLNIEVVATAQNGLEGLLQIRKHWPQLILTDLYMPVMDGIEMLKQTRKEGIDSEVIILSGYEDFKYAKSAVKLQVRDYLSKPTTITEIESLLQETVNLIHQHTLNREEEKELRELLRSNHALIQRQLFRGLLQTNPVQESYVNHVMDYLQLDLSNRYFAVILIEFYKNRELAQITLQEWSLFEYAVNNIMDEMTHEKEDTYVADVQRNAITVIFTVPKQTMEDYVLQKAKNVANEFLFAISSHLKIPVWATIGSIEKSLHNIHKSYKEAMYLLGERENLMGKQVIVLDDLKDISRNYPRRPVDVYHALADAIILGQRELVIAHIRTFMNTLKDMNTISVNVLRDFTMDFIGILISELYNNGIDMEEFNGSFKMYKEIGTFHSLADLEDWLQEVVLPIADRVEMRSNHKFKKTIDFITNYVHEHYQEDISLDLIANKVFLTRNYLSLIFKKATGENYNRYVTRVRMEKAKDLIRRGNYKLYEVSERVGYKNVTYFSQLFKKYTGCTPSEFGN